jgi:hypothetical protein
LPGIIIHFLRGTIIGCSIKKRLLPVKQKSFFNARKKKEGLQIAQSTFQVVVLSRIAPIYHIVNVVDKQSIKSTQKKCAITTKNKQFQQRKHLVQAYK